MDKTILHCDCNGFFASVECLLRPELRNVPMAVGGNPESRHGIILAKNELAKKYKIQTAETIWQAKQKCPNLVIVPPHHNKYAEYCHIVNEIYQRYTDLVEPFGIDESWLDITGSMHLFGGNGKDIADEIRAVITKETGLTISVGVSFNKAFAKLGSDYKKPDATTVIGRENYRQIVHPLPVDSLLFVGKSATVALNRLGINTIGDLAEYDEGVIVKLLGKMGKQIYDYACGNDSSAVRSAYEKSAMKSVGNGITFKRDLVSYEDANIAVGSLCDSVAARMRHGGVKCTTVQVQLKDCNFKTISRQRTLNTPTFLAREMWEIVMEIIKAEWGGTPLRAITISGTNLVGENENIQQLSMFEQENDIKREKMENIESTVDTLRQKFGKGVISIGSVIKNDLGIDD